MHQQSTATPASSSVTWDSLEAWVRERIQGFIQDLLEEEVTELLGRRKSERRAAVDPQPGYRNGYGKPRRLTLGCGTITVCRPRVRGLDARFQSRVLPLFARRTREVSALLPELYLHGLAAGDFDLALRGLVGQDAPLSASTVARLKARWQLEWETWSARRLDDLEVVYLWVDGVDVKAGLEKEKAALLVAIAGLSDGRKVVVAVAPGHRESAESWGALLRDLRDRGMPCPRLVIGDGHLGIWGGLREVYPEAAEQRCWNHRILNILDTLPRAQHAAAKPLLTAIAYAPTRAEAEERRATFEAWCRRHGYDQAAAAVGRDWDRFMTFYRFPRSTGCICGRRTSSNPRWRRCDCARTRPNGSSGSLMRRPSFGRCFSLPKVDSAASMRRSWRSECTWGSSIEMESKSPRRGPSRESYLHTH